MKKAAAMKWVKALRSGKYKQGKGMLKDPEGQYCCLGVLCEINKADIMVGDEMPPKELDELVGANGEWILDRPYSPGKEMYPQYELVELNDRGMSFKRIANIIEKKYRDL